MKWTVARQITCQGATKYRMVELHSLKYTQSNSIQKKPQS